MKTKKRTQRCAYISERKAYYSAAGASAAGAASSVAALASASALAAEHKILMDLNLGEFAHLLLRLILPL
ncbi:MAG: hypothetical protein II623_10985 [Paludibacteraceae bacterium]|nr:hypothetical protein [Paludibacteraceae bacterium]